MLKFEAVITCDHCGLTFTRYAYSKSDLPNVDEIQKYAKEKNWAIKEKAKLGNVGRHLCPACNYRWGDDE